jgi:flagellar protein FliO/FliZ
MTQTLLMVVLFVAAMAALPWLVRRLKLRQGALGGISASSRVLSQVGVGPNQRVVTVEVSHEGVRAVLVLGVTAQQIQCLHSLPVPGTAGAVPVPQATTPSFANAMDMAQAQAASERDGHA